MASSLPEPLQTLAVAVVFIKKRISKKIFVDHKLSYETVLRKERDESRM